MDSLKKFYKEVNSFDKEICLLEKVLKYIKENNIKLSYSKEFIKELYNFISIYNEFKNQQIYITSLLIDTSSRDYSSKAASIKGIKKIILDKFNEKDLKYLQINQNNLYFFLKKYPNLFTAYSESRYIDKDSSKKFTDKNALTNYFILKKEYESCKNIKNKFSIFHKDYKSLIVNEPTYNKPVYLGLGHLNQKFTYMEGPYFKGVSCPKCGSKIVHLLEGITKTGSIYSCSNFDCNFFINGNFFLKRGHDNLKKYFNINKTICEKRNSSHYRIFKTLKDIQDKKDFVEIEADGFLFKYKYYIEDCYIGFRLVEIEYDLDTLDLSIFYNKKYKIFNFLKSFFEENI